jgi:hypothetical protein
MNINLPYKVVINGVDRCLKASNWCNTHINKNEWDLYMADFRPVYTFSFNNTKQANWFRLKWQ